MKDILWKACRVWYAPVNLASSRISAYQRWLRPVSSSLEPLRTVQKMASSDTNVVVGMYCATRSDSVASVWVEVKVCVAMLAV